MEGKRLEAIDRGGGGVSITGSGATNGIGWSSIGFVELKIFYQNYAYFSNI